MCKWSLRSYRAYWGHISWHCICLVFACAWVRCFTHGAKSSAGYTPLWNLPIVNHLPPFSEVLDLFQTHRIVLMEYSKNSATNFEDPDNSISTSCTIIGISTYLAKLLYEVATCLSCRPPSCLMLIKLRRQNRHSQKRERVSVLTLPVGRVIITRDLPRYIVNSRPTQHVCPYNTIQSCLREPHHTSFCARVIGCTESTTSFWWIEKFN